MLARREHSRLELHTKLLRKGCQETVAAQIVEQLQQERLLSEERFVESLVSVRRSRGYGPVRIQRELLDKGIAPEAVERTVDAGSRDWIEQLMRVWQKKFGGQYPRSYAERAKQARFLQFRGFTYEQIQQALNPRDND